MELTRAGTKLRFLNKSIVKEEEKKYFFMNYTSDDKASFWNKKSSKPFIKDKDMLRKLERVCIKQQEDCYCTIVKEENKEKIAINNSVINSLSSVIVEKIIVKDEKTNNNYIYCMIEETNVEEKTEKLNNLKEIHKYLLCNTIVIVYSENNRTEVLSQLPKMFVSEYYCPKFRNKKNLYIADGTDINDKNKSDFIKIILKCLDNKISSKDENMSKEEYIDIFWLENRMSNLSIYSSLNNNICLYAKEEINNNIKYLMSLDSEEQILNYLFKINDKIIDIKNNFEILKIIEKIKVERREKSRNIIYGVTILSIYKKYNIENRLFEIANSNDSKTATIFLSLNSIIKSFIIYSLDRYIDDKIELNSPFLYNFEGDLKNIENYISKTLDFIEKSKSIEKIKILEIFCLLLNKDNYYNKIDFSNDRHMDSLAKSTAITFLDFLEKVFGEITFDKLRYSKNIIMFISDIEKEIQQIISWE